MRQKWHRMEDNAFLPPLIRRPRTKGKRYYYVPRPLYASPEISYGSLVTIHSLDGEKDDPTVEVRAGLRTQDDAIITNVMWQDLRKA